MRSPDVGHSACDRALAAAQAWYEGRRHPRSGLVSFPALAAGLAVTAALRRVGSPLRDDDILTAAGQVRGLTHATITAQLKRHGTTGDIPREAGRTSLSTARAARELAAILTEALGELAADDPSLALTADVLESYFSERVRDDYLAPRATESERERPWLARRLGASIHDRRHDLGISITELAARAGISPDTLRRIERGATRSVRLETVQRIVDALGSELTVIPRRVSPSPDGPPAQPDAQERLAHYRQRFTNRGLHAEHTPLPAARLR